MKNKMVIACIILLLTAIVVNVEYVSAQTKVNEGYFEQTYLTIEKDITFTAIEPGKGLKSISIKQTNSISKPLTAGYSLATMPTFSKTDTEYYQNPWLATTSYFNSSNSYLLLTNISKSLTAKSNYYNISPEIKDNLSKTVTSGYRLFTYFKPAPMVAREYCEAHGLVFGNITYENLTYKARSNKLMSIEMVLVNHSKMEEIGYSSTGEIISLFFVGLMVTVAICLIVVTIWGTAGGGFVALADALTPEPPDPPVQYGDNITTIIMPPDPPSAEVLNETYRIYLDLCNKTGTMPSAEGFQEFLAQTYGKAYDWDAPLVTISTNRSQNTQYQTSAPGNLISAFVSDIISIIFFVVIIVVIAIALIIVVKIFGFMRGK